MKTNEKHEVVAQFARRSLVPVCLFVAALCFVGPSRAQSNAGSATSPAVKPADGAMSPSQAPLARVQSSGVAPTTEQVAQNSPAKPSAPKGQSEGIKVHGHWTIEVRNPDGKVVTHREFENAIAPNGALPLTGVLSGEYTTGGFEVEIGGSLELCSGLPSCYLVDSRNSWACSEEHSPCGALTYTPNTISGGFTVGYTLTGSIQPTAGSSVNYISFVQSGIFVCTPVGGISPTTPQACVTTGPTSGGWDLEQLTSTSISPIQFTSGQSLSVTVVISFSS